MRLDRIGSKSCWKHNKTVLINTSITNLYSPSNNQITLDQLPCAIPSCEYAAAKSLMCYLHGEWCRVQWKGGQLELRLYFVAQVGNSARNNQCLDSATHNRWTQCEKIKRWVTLQVIVILGVGIALQVCFRKQNKLLFQFWNWNKSMKCLYSDFHQ